MIGGCLEVVVANATWHSRVPELVWWWVQKLSLLGFPLQAYKPGQPHHRLQHEYIIVAHQHWSCVSLLTDTVHARQHLMRCAAN